MNARERVQLWNWINEYTVTCGGNPSDTRYARERREEAVARIEQTVEEIVARIAGEVRTQAADTVRHLSHEDGLGMGSQRIEGAILAGAAIDHDWQPKAFGPIPSTTIYACQKCCVVRRADNQNKPCKGVVKVGLRDDSEESSP